MLLVRSTACQIGMERAQASSCESARSFRYPLVGSPSNFFVFFSFRSVCTFSFSSPLLFLLSFYLLSVYGSLWLSLSLSLLVLSFSPSLFFLALFLSLDLSVCVSLCLCLLSFFVCVTVPRLSHAQDCVLLGNICRSVLEPG